MSDFLHNLIARSYDLKPVARPRLASRFEPTPGGPLLNESLNAALESEEFGPSKDELKMNAKHAAREPFAEQAFESSSTKETQPPHSTSDAEQLFTRQIIIERRPSHAEPITDDANAQSLSTPAPNTATASTQQLNSSDIQASAEQSAHASRAGQTASDSSRKRRDVNAEEHSINQTAEVERETAPAERGGLRESLRQSIREQFANEAQPTQDIFSSRELETQRERRSVVPARVSAQSKMTEGEESSAPVSAEKHSAETTTSVGPVIRVTIGRIDVRAVMPDAKVERPIAYAPARRTQAPLSLEEYLKQRNGGGR